MKPLISSMKLGIIHFHNDLPPIGPNAAIDSRTGMVDCAAMAMSGRKRMKRRNSTEKTPNVPKKVKISTIVGLMLPQLEGRKSRVSDVQIINPYGLLIDG